MDPETARSLAEHLASLDDPGDEFDGVIVHSRLRPLRRATRAKVEYLLRTWTCPRCWEVVEAIDPAWCTPAFWNEREAWRLEHGKAGIKHVSSCLACQAYDTPDGLIGDRPACYPNLWRYDGRTEVHRRAVAGEAP